MSNTQQENTAKTVINPQMTIDQILSLFPHKAKRLSQEITNAGLHCIGCHAATWETLEAGMLGHGMNEAAIEKLVMRLNTLLAEPDSDQTTITMTENAAKKFNQILAEESKVGWALRFGDRMAGCSGFEYVLDYSEKPDADDEVFESEGVKIHVSKSCLDRLRGSRIDYKDGLQGGGFTVDNLNAKSSCGCGSSHNYN